LTSSSGRVNTSTSTSLELKLSTDIFKVFATREVRDLDHASSSETCSEVRGAGEDVTKMVVMHEVFAHALEGLGNDGSGFCETVENGVYIITLLHRNNSRVIFLINPDEEVSSLIVENTTSVGPVASTSRREK
jgi:hypothetical protein